MADTQINAQTAPSGLQHTFCGTAVEVRPRDVVTVPYDPPWPDTAKKIDIAYCPKCNKFVGVRDVERTA